MSKSLCHLSKWNTLRSYFFDIEYLTDNLSEGQEQHLSRMTMRFSYDIFNNTFEAIILNWYSAPDVNFLALEEMLLLMNRGKFSVILHQEDAKRDTVLKVVMKQARFTSSEAVFHPGIPQTSKDADIQSILTTLDDIKYDISGESGVVLTKVKGTYGGLSIERM